MWVSGSTVCLLLALCGLSRGKEVTLPDHGTLDGTTTLSAWSNRTIYQYQGIPFAKPPVGRLRFRRPLPYTTRWRTTFKATKFGPVCPQENNNNLRLGEEVQDEDCLHINVYTPKTKHGGVGEGMPVIVYVHGGYFLVGSSRNVHPNYMLEQDVVLVVPQYRLGPLGFLSLKTDEVPGNQGMLDMILALEWVQRNIKHFGGDPGNVTIFGNSAGGAIATLMMFSPLVRDGLIKRVIAQGGSALGTWVVDPDPITHAQMIAALANCNQSNFTDLAKCLRDDASVQDLLDALYLFKESGNSGGHLIVVNEAGGKSFLPDTPHVLLKEGKFKHLPVMGGITKHEGSFLLADLYDILLAANLTTSKEFLTRNFTRSILEFFGIDDGTGFIANIMRDTYFTDDQLGDFIKMVPGLIDIISVVTVKACTFTMVNEMSRLAPSYMYSFNYQGRFTTHGSFSTYGGDPKRPWNYPFPVGIAHSDELLYIFPQDYAVLNKKEKAVAKKMIQFLTSFAATGEPKACGAPDWPKVSTGKGPYLKVESKPTVHENFIDEYFIAVKEGLAPYNPPYPSCVRRP